MTKEKLQQTVTELIESDKEFIQKLIEKAISSGCMDIEGAPDNYLLPKNLLTAIYREMSRQYAPLHQTRAQKKTIDNIYVHL